MQDTTNAGPEVPNHGDGETDLTDIEALRAELAKWQARVPKLAAALRERTEEAERLQDQLGEGPLGAGERARAELIEELEAKLATLTSRHQDLQGQLHSRDVEANGLRQDVADWRAKWQALTETLDQEAAAATQRSAELANLKADLESVEQQLAQRQAGSAEQEQELALLRDEAESLKRRNEQLFETTELANKQLDSLGATITQLQDSLTSKDGELVELQARLDADTGASAEQLATRDAQIRELNADVDALHVLVENKQRAVTELETQLAQRAESGARIGELEQALAELGREHEQLVTDAASVRRELDEASAQQQALAGQLAARDAQQAERQAAADAAREAAEAAEHAAAQAQAQAEAEIRKARHETDTALGELRAQLSTEQQEVARLEGCVQEAASTTGNWEQERRDLSGQLKEAQQQVVRLQAQLEERSTLVVGLEQEKLALADDAKALAAENSTLTDQVRKAERHAEEHAEHITQLDARLERQRELMNDLEAELAQAQRAASQPSQAGFADRDREIASLREELASAQRLAAESTATAPPVGDTPSPDQAAEVQKLERMLRDRTEALNKLQWQQSMAQQAGAGDDKSLVVLNQQLADARADGERLAQRVQELEQQLTLTAVERADGVGSPTPAGADDLTQIKGIGPKVAAQLRELGIGGYLQIAELDLRELDDAAHPLNAFKGRIVKDAWVAQARELELRKPARG